MGQVDLRRFFGNKPDLQPAIFSQKRTRSSAWTVSWETDQVFDLPHFLTSLVTSYCTCSISMFNAWVLHWQQ